MRAAMILQLLLASAPVHGACANVASLPSDGHADDHVVASPSADRGFDAKRAAVDAYARHVAAEYALLIRRCEALKAAVRAFCDAPDEAKLAAARTAWIAAREVYGRTEAFRFGGGPIDAKRGGVETFVNAWPVDEAYIDSVDASGSGGIIGTPARFPSLAPAMLRIHNQHGGETNICTGFHAIEFMLWGQDKSDDGPGARPASHFIDDRAAFAERRREYLVSITEMLCDDLAKVEREWRVETGAYRAVFIKDTDRALRAMITGPALLVSFEMAGERLAVPLETRDQEEEHSCFSDTTHLDHRANVRGVDSVLRGRDGPGVIDVVRAVDSERATKLEAALAAAFKAVDDMPAPFDRAIRAADDSPERVRLKTALVALEALGREIGLAGKALGWSLPTEPTG